MATKEQIYAAFAFPDSPAQINTVVGFTSQSMLQVYQGQIRAEARLLGYYLPPISVDDPSVLEKLNAESRAIAESIGPTVNSMLENQIKALPEGLSVDEARTALQPFFDSVHEYNDSTLIPYASSFARQSAISDFYANNTTPEGKTLKDAVQWTWTQTTDYEDDCTEAAAASPADYETLVGIGGDEPPVHPNCQCSLDANELDEGDVPTDLWTGAAA